MTTIDSTGRFLAQMREQISAVGRQARIAKPALGKAPNRAGKQPPRDIHGLILQRVLGIDPGDPDRRRKAFRIFLETVLTDELGADLINDPAFHQVIDNVQRSMEQDATLLPAIDTAGEFLLKSAYKT